MSHLQETMKGIENRELAAGTDVGAAAESGSLADVAASLGSGESVDLPPEGERAADVWGPYDPDVSDTIIYQPRRGEIRRGRKRIAAIVTHRYPEARLFDLAIIFEASDMLDQQRVPEAVGEERGWIVKHPIIAAFEDIALSASRVAGANENETPENQAMELKAEISQLRALVLGSFDMPENSVLDMINDIDGRVDKIMSVITAESAPAKAKKATATKPAKKAKRGR